MPIVNKTKHTAAIFNRGREVVKVYDHGTLAWQKSIPDYLCFTALEAGQFTLTIPAAVTPTYLSYIEWSKDGRTWNHTDNTSEAVTIDVQVAQGDKVYWRGSGAAMAAPYVQGNASNFTSTARFDASGHIMSLLKGNDFANYTHLQGNTIDGILSRTFTYLFYHCDTIVNACDLVLPTFTSYHVNIYYSLFDTCTSLLTMPPLPSTELAGGCYTRLCFGCSSLLNAVPLPATTLANGCYNSMYYGCTSLTKGSDLPATNLVLNCYYMMYNGCSSLTDTGTLGMRILADGSCDRMFQSCSSLNYVKCLATDITAANCIRYWLNGVSSTGTFIQASGVTWPRGASGIPTGWLAYDEGEDIPNDYTPCDYIYNSSTGGGGVDLGFKFRLLDYSVEAKFKQDEINNGMVCGTNANDSGAIWYYNYTGRGSFRVYACYSGTWRYDREGFAPIDTDIHIIRYVGDADGCYQISDGTQSSSTSLSTWAADESTNNLFIFGRAVSSNTYKGRIYYLKVWNTATEEVICNLIPCSRNSDGAAGFWDTAQERFFTSTYWTAHFDNE